MSKTSEGRKLLHAKVVKNILRRSSGHDRPTNGRVGDCGIASIRVLRGTERCTAQTIVQVRGRRDP